MMRKILGLRHGSIQMHQIAIRLLVKLILRGGEYILIIDTPLNVLKKFKVLVIEFHNLNLISNRINYNLYLNVFKKILSIFNICHLHINNSEKPINIKGINIPPVIEFTFLRKDFMEQFSTNINTS